MNKNKNIIISVIVILAIMLGLSVRSYAETTNDVAEKQNERTTETVPTTAKVTKPDNVLTDDQLASGITVGNIWGGTFCLAENIRISQGSNELHRDIAKFQNGSLQMPLDPPKGYRMKVDKLYIGEGVTTETVSKYKTTETKTLGETSETAKAAYLARFYKDHKRWDSDVQAGMWTTTIAVQKQNVTNPVEREAAAYEKFVKDYEKKTANGGAIIKDTVINAVVGTDITEKKQWLGKYKIDYVRGVAKEEGRDKVEFGGIVSAILYDQNDNKISEDAWEFVPATVKDGKERSDVPEYDRDYKYPYPGEEFYIKVDASKLQGVTKIKRIEYVYQRLDIRAEAKMISGTIDKITWQGKKVAEKCFGAVYRTIHDPMTGLPTGKMLVAKGKCGCIDEGRVHEYNVQHFIIEKDRQTSESQPMMIITEIREDTPTTKVTIPTVTPYRLYIPSNLSTWPYWPYWPDYPNYPDRPDGDLTFTIAGIVWEDTKTGKESDFDGQIGTANSGSAESGIKNVEVKLYKHGETSVIKSTYTDSNGAYVFNEIPVGTYDVGFVYDGMTYTTTKAFASGSASDYEKNPNDEKYILNSKAEELPSDRQNFNNQFEIIDGSGSNGYGLSEDEIWYETSNGKSKLQTTYSDGKVKKPFQLETKTSNTISVGFPFTNNVNNSSSKTTIGGQEYYANYKYMAYVNLGLKKRETVDFALTKDVSTATLTINGKQTEYKYNARAEDTFEIEAKNQPVYSNIHYNREIYNTDYTYRIDVYNNDLGTVSKADIMGVKSQDQELKVFVTYKVKVINQSVIYSGTINELVDYYDSKYVLIEQDKKLDIRNDDGTWVKDKIVAEAPYYITESGQKGSLKINKNGTYNGYNKVYLSGIEDEILQSGEYIYLYITFEVDKPDSVTRNIAKGDKNNLIEISSYSTYEAQAVVKTNTVGMIDRDSAPGNLNPADDSTIEDDSDKAPAINIKLSEEAPRRIYGTVWEDERDEKKAEKGEYSTGNGIRDNGEQGVDGVIVQLVEIVNDINGNKVGEYIWQEMFSGGTAYSYMNISGTLVDGDYGKEKQERISGMEAGEYQFEGYVPGDYIVRFIYGSDERTINPDMNNGKSYNGQDYKSTVYLQGEDVGREWYDVNSDYLNKTLLSDAKDREDRRMEVINYSKKVNFDIAEVLASPENKKKELWNELAEKTQMVAETAKMRVEIEKEKDSDSAYVIPNIDLGMVERPKADLELNKEIEWIKITLADGSTLIDTEAGIKKNVNWVSNRIYRDQFRKGAIHIYMDEEVMQGANIQIKYKITITNKSELDYTGNGTVGEAYYTGVKGASDYVVKTKINYIADYVDNTLAYREDDNTSGGWKSLAQIDNLQSVENMSGKYLDPNIVDTINKNVGQILVNDSKTNTALAPNEQTYVELILSKALSSSSKDDPTFDNIAEILQYTNDVGRRSEIPGDQDPTQDPTAGKNDSDCAEQITITPPTGENRAYYFVLITAVLVILSTGIILIKKKVLDK